jgi:hypothetical protein
MASCPAQVFRPRKPQHTPLYRLVSEHWEEFKAIHEERFEPHYGPLRSHVIRVVENYLRCGILDHGFARFRCEKCGLSYFAAYSCKGRCFCPSCMKKRQILFGEFLTQEILEEVPHAHANFTVPKRLRRHFYFNRKLLSKLARCAYQTLRQALKETCPTVIPGAVSLVHTAGSSMAWHPHAHLIITLGGWPESGAFIPIAPPPRDVLEVLFKHRVFRMLLDEGAISEDLIESMLQWHHSGFDAFIGQEVSGNDRNALENLAQYIAKGPVSLQNLEYSREQQEVTYRTSNTHSRHGPSRTLDPLEFLAELTTHIAQPFERITNYHGYYSNASRGKRRKVLAASRNTSDPPQTAQCSPAPPSRKTWARLINKVYEVDPLRCHCGGKLKPIALIDDPDVIYRILKHCNLLETEQDARAPPEELTYTPCET